MSVVDNMLTREARKEAINDAVRELMSEASYYDEKGCPATAAVYREVAQEIERKLGEEKSNG